MNKDPATYLYPFHIQLDPDEELYYNCELLTGLCEREIVGHKRLNFSVSEHEHVLKLDDDDWVKKSMEYEVEVVRSRG